jgi:hypothetical protein
VHARTGLGSSDNERREKRVQILHRDLKPDNGEWDLWCFIGPQLLMFLLVFFYN